jgi:hypothetical protein
MPSWRSADAALSVLLPDHLSADVVGLLREPFDRVTAPPRDVVEDRRHEARTARRTPPTPPALAVYVAIVVVVGRQPLAWATANPLHLGPGIAADGLPGLVGEPRCRVSRSGSPWDSSARPGPRYAR